MKLHRNNLSLYFLCQFLSPVYINKHLTFLSVLKNLVVDKGLVNISTSYLKFTITQYILNFEHPNNNLLYNKMHIYFNVFCSNMKHEICSKGTRTPVITPDHNGNYECYLNLFKQLSYPCNFDINLTGGSTFRFCRLQANNFLFPKAPLLSNNTSKSLMDLLSQIFSTS